MLVSLIVGRWGAAEELPFWVICRAGSIVNNGGITGQYLLGFGVEFTGDLMDLVFSLAPGAAQPNPAAHPVDLKFAFTFSTFHLIWRAALLW